MSRASIDVERASGLVTGRDAIWIVIRDLKTFSLRDIEIYSSDSHKLADISAALARPYILGLHAAGFLKQLADEERTQGQAPKRWELIKDAGINAPRVHQDGKEVTQGRSREQMWQSMRILKEFSAKDLAIAASTPAINVPEHTAKDYVYNLHKSGYLKLTTRAKNSGGLSRYRLLPSMYTGPKPPMVQRIKQIFDANLNKVMWPRDGE